MVDLEYVSSTHSNTSMHRHRLGRRRVAYHLQPVAGEHTEVAAYMASRSSCAASPPDAVMASRFHTPVPASPNLTARSRLAARLRGLSNQTWFTVVLEGVPVAKLKKGASTVWLYPKGRVTYAPPCSHPSIS